MSSSSATVRIFRTADTDINHFIWAVRRSDTAADGVEILVALGEPVIAKQFTVSALVNLAGTTAIGIRLVAVSSIVTEAGVMGTVLPADWSNSRVALLTVWIAKGAIFLFLLGARVQRLTCSAAISLLPARVGHISVMIVMMEVVDWCAIIVLLSVSEGLFGTVSETRHVLFTIVHAVDSSCHGVNVHAMKAAMMQRAVIEMLGIVMMVVHVAVLSFSQVVFAMPKVAIVVERIVDLVRSVMLFIESLDVVVIDDMMMLNIVLLNGGDMRQILNDSMLVIGCNVGHLFEVDAMLINHVWRSNLGVFGLGLLWGRLGTSLRSWLRC